jgi:mRNA interferase HigB
MYPSADYIGNERYCFNIGGGKNTYRMVVMIHFSSRTVYLRWLGTHTEYDKLNAKDLLRFV